MLAPVRSSGCPSGAARSSSQEVRCRAIALRCAFSSSRYCSCLSDLRGLSSWMVLMVSIRSSMALIFARFAEASATAATRNQLGRGTCACQRPVFAGNNHTGLAEATIACQRPEWHHGCGREGDIDGAVHVALVLIAPRRLYHFLWCQPAHAPWRVIWPSTWRSWNPSGLRPSRR